MVEIIPGGAGCLHDEGEQRKGFIVYLSKGEYAYDPFQPVVPDNQSTGRGMGIVDISYTSPSLDDGQIMRSEIALSGLSTPGRYRGSFTLPEGARSFQLVAPRVTITSLVDPNGKDWLANYERTAALWPIRFVRGRSIVLTLSTSDLDYSYQEVAVPGEWKLIGESHRDHTPSMLLVVKTRNDPDDKIRLKVVNATSHPNEAFAPRLDRMTQLAAHLGFTLEISALEKIPHRDNPHALPDDFCERFCSSDEAVVFITEPGGWSSPGPGIALNMAYNTHFLEGAEIATKRSDHELTAALHELLHYAAGLGHPFKRYVDGSFDTDGLASTGIDGEIVDGATRIAGGVNYQELLRNGSLQWNDNILGGWRMTPNVRDVDGFGWTNDQGERYALVTFLEHHQLEWLKNSPLYW